MHNPNNIVNNESGATIVYVAITLGVLLMFTALAIDVGHLYGVRNELQNAADAGALAGASMLFNKDSGDLTALAAYEEATRVVNINKTGKDSVVAKTVQIGHWSFNSPAHTFQSAGADLEGLEQLEGWEKMLASDLDGEEGYINAVRVVTERADTPSFFAKILGYPNFLVSTEAIGYRGFAGRFKPGDFDQPIAICQQSVTNGGEITEGAKLDCNVGRMINSGGNAATSNTGAWTDFSQPCNNNTNKNTVSPLICSTGNINFPDSGDGIGTSPGMVDNVFDDLMACWQNATNKVKNWSITLPLVDCPGNNVDKCSTLIGAISLNVIWMIEKISEGQNKYQDVPRYMEIWDMVDGEPVKSRTFSNPTTTEPDDFEAWKDFVDEFSLKNADGRPTNREDTEGYDQLYQHKAIFFLPNCEFNTPTGSNGEFNTGVISRSPVLVQ